MLLPLVYRPRSTELRYAVGLVPHYSDKDIMAVDDPAVAIVDVQSRDWRTTVDQIAACDVIVSSSLHGIIVAEAYGIPAVWVQPSDRLKGGSFKFRDYYEGTGRDAQLADWNRGLAAAVAKASTPPAVDPSPLLAAAQEVRLALATDKAAH